MANDPVRSATASEEGAGRPAILTEAGRTRVTRVTRDDGVQVLCRQPADAVAERRLHHERTILERLIAVPGVTQLSSEPPRPGALVTVDPGGSPLGARKMPLDIPTAVNLATQLSNVVAMMHRRGVVHRDINPSNVVVTPEGHAVVTGFGRATMFAEERPSFSHPNEIAGTLAYLAPEQTGRTGRSVDHRADLYGLGATLYEIVTGRPPFGTNDPLRLTHDHLARMPRPPSEVNPEVPARFSAIILHLLEKEPDHRYQSAEGLAFDLSRVDKEPHGGIADQQLGVRDLPVRLLPPSRLIGRAREVAGLGAALDDAVAGRLRGLVVAGRSGVGKSALLDELRPMVTAVDGWFVAGKADEFSHGPDADPVRQAFRALVGLLLAEPESALAELRTRIRDTVGPNVSILAGVLPELAALLGVPGTPHASDPLNGRQRLIRAGVDLVRVVASPRRPLVMVLDDLQWASMGALGFMDEVLTAEDVTGVLVVGAYRDDDADRARPLNAMLARWRRLGVAPRQITLANLKPMDLATMLAEMLHLDQGRAEGLAELVEISTAGNPFDTVELLNGLRRDDVLVPSEEGWTWDPGVLRRHLGRTDVAHLLLRRVAQFAPATQVLLETIACLGGSVDLTQLHVATAQSIGAVEEQLRPALEDGLLVSWPGRQDCVRFRHDRVQESVLNRLSPHEQHARRLQLARRLAKHPKLRAAAAEQYLPVVDAVRAQAERADASAIMREAAVHARLVSNYAAVARFLDAALRLTDGADAAAQTQMRTERMAALLSLGRLAEADAEFSVIESLETGPLQRVDATCVRISSLTNRDLHEDAIGAGLSLLRELGRPIPPADQLDSVIHHGLQAVHRWLDTSDVRDDLERSELAEPVLVAAAKVINRILPSAYFSAHDVFAWLALQAVGIWAEHGPAAALVGPLSHVPFMMVELADDYRTGRRAIERVLAASEARGYEPDTSQGLFLYALGVGQWHGALEDNVSRGYRAREGLIRGGDLQNACFTYYATGAQLFDCSPSLSTFAAEAQSAISFANRTGNDLAGKAFRAYGQVAGALSGENDGALVRSAASAQVPLRGSAQVLDENPTTAANIHVTYGIAAAIFNEPDLLAWHAGTAMRLLSAITADYPTAIARVLYGLVLAARMPDDAVERDLLASELDQVCQWLAERAVDAPVNFTHLLHLVGAERAAALGDAEGAASEYEAAIREAAGQTRPWHRALILERAAQFHLHQALDHTGRALLREARQVYDEWGARAKVADLDQQHPSLAAMPVGVPGDLTQAEPASTGTTGAITSGAIDLLAILDASQALSSETSIDRLRARVTDVLSAMTGATSVHVLVRREDGSGWLIPPAYGDRPAPPPIGFDDETPLVPLVPVSAVRYAERTREPLLVADATADDRFSRDPYLAGLQTCSLLVVPVLNRGVLRAMLVLENRLIHGAFSPERLNSVLLLAGQLAVSLENALVYSSLERKVAERTEELADANRRLERLSVTDSLTGLANRRRLEVVLHAEWRRAMRAQQPLALTMADIDHFKAFNDRFGHPAGDECLVRIADSLRENTRETDLVARYGGEEFAIVMPSTDAQAAAVQAERVRAGVAALAIPNPGAPGGIVTASFGVSGAVPTPDHTVAQLVQQSDELLYEAKRAGRNRVRPGE